jgi:hypothetical protein
VMTATGGMSLPLELGGASPVWPVAGVRPGGPSGDGVILPGTCPLAESASHAKKALHIPSEHLPKNPLQSYVGIYD